MDVLWLLWDIYKWGFVGGFTLGFVVMMVQGFYEMRFVAFLEALFMGIFMGVLWPFMVVMSLYELQGEYGIFWRSAAWKPQSVLVLETLHREGRELRSLEIVAASKERVRRVGLHSLLIRLEGDGLVSARRETDAEAEAHQIPGEPLYHSWLYKITDAGRRRRADKRKMTPRAIWDALPRPA